MTKADMPYYCSCQDKDGNTITSTVLGERTGQKGCFELQQVQFRIYEAAPKSSILNWKQTFTLTPEKRLVLCKTGVQQTVKVPWSAITETLMEVTTVKPYGEVATTMHADGSVSFDNFSVANRCHNLCPLNLTTITQHGTAVQPFRTTT